MLRLLIVTVLLCLLVTTSWSQRLDIIPNGSFENWQQENNVLKPEQWEAMDSIKPTTDAAFGDSAIKLKPIQTLETLPQFLSIHLPVGEKAALLSANVKTRIPNNQDTVYFRARLYYAGNDTQTVKWQTAQNINSYKRINLSPADQVIDSVEITFQSGCCAALGGADSRTVMKVDDVRFVRTLSTEGPPKNAGLKLFPNPVSQALRLKGLNRNSYYQIFNSLGKKVKEGAVSASGFIPIAELPKGVYQLRIPGHQSSGNKVGSFVKH